VVPAELLADLLADLLVGGVEVSGVEVSGGVLVSGAVVLEGGVVPSPAEVVGSPPPTTDVDDGVGDGVTSSVTSGALLGRLLSGEPPVGRPAGLVAAAGGAPEVAGTEGAPGEVPGWAVAVPPFLGRAVRRPAEEAGIATEPELMAWAAGAGGSVTCGTSSAAKPARNSTPASTNDTATPQSAIRCRRRGGGEMVVSGAACRGRRPAAVEPVRSVATPLCPAARCRPARALPMGLLPVGGRCHPANEGPTRRIRP
jgi:hypothetical protein